MFKLSTVFGIIVLIPSLAFGEIRMVSRGDATSNYAEELIRTAMSMAKADGKDLGDVVKVSGQFDAITTRNMLERGELDVIITGHSLDLDKRFKRIEVDIFNGMLGYRLCLMPRGKSLAHIQNVEDLKQIRVASGTGWRDTDILMRNGLNVVTGKYKELFKTTSEGKADCYLRALHEITMEQTQFMRSSVTDKFDVAYNFYVSYPSSFGFYMQAGDDRTELLASYIDEIKDNILSKTRQGKIWKRESKKLSGMVEIKLDGGV